MVRSLLGAQRKAAFCLAGVSQVSWLWFLIPSPERLPKYRWEHASKGNAPWLLLETHAAMKGTSERVAREQTPWTRAVHCGWKWPLGFKGSAGGCMASPKTCEGQLSPSLSVSPSLRLRAALSRRLCGKQFDGDTRGCWEETHRRSFFITGVLNSFGIEC